MNAPADNGSSGGAILRGPATWYAYLALGFFTYLINIQGNILPFLKAELDLSYRAVSLHSTAFAAGLIVVGLVGDRVIRWCGRRRALWLGTGGIAFGSLLLCVAPAAWATIASCALMGGLGGLIPSMIPAVLVEIHGVRKEVAMSEASAVTYGFAIMAPLSTGLCVAIGLGWRPALLLGAVFGIVVAFLFRRTELAEPAAIVKGGSSSLPAAYWAYWCVLATVIAIEFCVLLWAPEFLGRVVGLPPAWAAAGAASFSLAMLLGRYAASRLVLFIASRILFQLALLLTLAGFLVYWSALGPAVAIAGLFVLGLGVAPFYPLGVSFAIGAAGTQGAAASARIMFAAGIAILSIPTLLGGFADDVGLRSAHLVLPALVLVAFVGFCVAQALERRGVTAAALASR